MFTYRLYKTGRTWNGIDVSDRIFSRDPGIVYDVDPNDEEICPIDFPDWYVGYSAQLIEKDDFLHYAWDGNSFNPITQAQQDELNAYYTTKNSTSAARASMLVQLRNEILAESDWSQLSTQHKKLLLHIDLTEDDWSALGC